MELELIILKIAGILSAIGAIWKFGLPIFQRIKKRLGSQARLEKMIETDLMKLIGGFKMSKIQFQQTVEILSKWNF